MPKAGMPASPGQRQQTGLRHWQQGLAFVSACCIVVSRRPDAVFHAQFWAEDGHVWFAEAYNFGAGSALLRAYAGYFQTLPRLAAAVTLLVPFALAPLVLNLIAIVLQALPASILLARRSAPWGNQRARAIMAAIYLALPNTREIEAIVTNAQWVLALSAFLLLVATAPPPLTENWSLAQWLFDLLILLLCGLTGPFCMFLLPIAIWLAWRDRPRTDNGRLRSHIRAWTKPGILAASCVLQAWALLVADPAGRAHAALGARPALLLRILGGQVFLGALLGGNRLASLTSLPVFALLPGAAIGGCALLAVSFRQVTPQLRLFILFSCAILAAALLSPESYPAAGQTRWQALAAAGGIRYWFLPTLAFAWSLLACANSRVAWLRRAAVVLLAVMCFGIARDWELPAFTDMHFKEQAKRFENAAPDSTVVIPENPQGWTIQLKRKPAP